jgi:uncharacterized protein (TIGR00255 family)
MIRSMTAFASRTEKTQGSIVSWEIKSVNHRFLDLSLRVPEPMRFLEPEVRALLGRRLGRGRVECSLQIRTADDTTNVLEPNLPVIDQIISLAEIIQKRSNLQFGPMTPLELLKWPQALRVPELNYEQLTQPVLDLLESTLTELTSSRETEGRQLAASIEKKCHEIKAFVCEAKVRIPTVLKANRDKLKARLLEVSENLQPDRLEQECVYLAQKMDITEEIERLESHIDEALNTLTLDTPVGRKLDFLLQEFNREANTLGSKSQDIVTTRASLAMKVLIEQIREQVQNIE